MIPILYDKNEHSFDHGGIGYLSEVTKATVTEERNGLFELSLVYPTTGMWFDKIEKGSIVKAKPNETSTPQLFRIYKVGKPISGAVTYSAEHISYELSGLPVPGFKVPNVTAAAAIASAMESALLPCRFTAWSDITTLNGTNIPTPCSLRAILGGQRGSILDVWGGEYEFDNFTVKLHAHRGEDRGVTVEYGKNLTDLRQEESIAECFTHLLPYVTYTEGQNSPEKRLFLTDPLLPVPDAASVGHARALVMDFADRFTEGETVTEAALLKKATAYLKIAALGAPKVNISVSFLQLWQTEEYKHIAPLERVGLCDTVTVRFPALGVEAKAKVIKTVYDALKEKYESVTLGDAKSSLADSMNKTAADMQTVAHALRTRDSRAAAEIRRAVDRATALITGNAGGYLVLHPAEMPQELLILDSPRLEDAVNVWRWNAGGLGHSSTGYNGRFTTAITQDGQIVADFITAGKLSGALIEAGTLDADSVRTAWNGSARYLELSGGALNIYASAGKSPAERILCLNRYGTWYYYTGETVGWIGSNYIEGSENVRGLNFELEPGGAYMGWAERPTEDEGYRAVFSYSRAGAQYEEEGLHLGCALHGHNHTLRGVNLENIASGGTAAWSGEIPIVTEITREEDGGIGFSYSTVTVKNGIITSAPRAKS